MKNKGIINLPSIEFIVKLHLQCLNTINPTLPIMDERAKRPFANLLPLIFINILYQFTKKSSIFRDKIIILLFHKYEINVLWQWLEPFLRDILTCQQSSISLWSMIVTIGIMNGHYYYIFNLKMLDNIDILLRRLDELYPCAHSITKKRVVA